MPVARLRGVVEEKGDDWLIVGVGGVGILALVPGSAAGALREGDAATLYTYLHVREDALTLYGFLTRDDLRIFEQLIGVSGVGPRAALGLLSALDCAQLATAVAAGHADVLRRVPGIGQKTAERIVLDLRDKVTPPLGEGAPSPAPKAKDADAEVVAALMGLGYSQAESTDAAARAEAEDGAGLEERIRAALSFFAGA